MNIGIDTVKRSLMWKELLVDWSFVSRRLALSLPEPFIAVLFVTVMGTR
jgi:hypothetical protein